MKLKPRDEWAEWLLHRRHGGDPEALRRQLAWLYPIRDRVLGNAHVREGDVVLDVGCGDGLIAFGALEKVGPSGRVIFSDISQDLLDHSRALAEQIGELERCTFVRAGAQDLSPLADGSVDVVTTRSVIIYVKPKERALREFFRVLRAGGRLSMFEPINRFSEPRAANVSYEGLDMSPVIDIYRKIRPGDPATMESARNLLKNIFYDSRRYDLAKVGRYKMNKKLGPKLPLTARTLESPLDAT